MGTCCSQREKQTSSLIERNDVTEVSRSLSHIAKYLEDRIYVRLTNVR